MIATLLVSSFLFSYPQHIEYLQSHKPQAYAIMYAADIATGCLVGGVNAWWNDGSFKDGCFGGVIGSTISFGGKSLMYYSQVYPGVGAVGKLASSVGGSVIANAATNRELFSRLMIRIGPAELVFEKGKGLNDLNVNPLMLYGLADYIYLYKLDLKRSVFNLTPIFHGKFTRSIAGDPIIAAENFGSLVYNDYYSLPYILNCTLSHEMIHVAQFENYKFANDILSAAHMNVGQDLYRLVTGLFSNLDKTYYYSPIELEAYSLQYPFIFPPQE